MATKLDRELEQLGAMSRDALVERWQVAYGCPPPAGARRELLLYAAGWHIQAKRLGGFSGEVRRTLRREVDRIHRDCSRKQDVAIDDGSAGVGQPQPLSDGPTVFPSNAADTRRADASSTKRRQPIAGTRLLRDWNGQTHAVDVTANGYLYDGQQYRSLTAIARRITGAHWSGPRFFGL